MGMVRRCTRVSMYSPTAVYRGTSRQPHRQMNYVSTVPWSLLFHVYACRCQAFWWTGVHAPLAWWKRVGSLALFMEVHGTIGLTHGSMCIDWKSWKRMETTETFPDALTRIQLTTHLLRIPAAAQSSVWFPHPHRLCPPLQGLNLVFKSTPHGLPKTNPPQMFLCHRPVATLRSTPARTS